MNSITYFNASDFMLKEILSIKKNKKVFVIFSTYGEREAEHIYDKITLLNSVLSELIDAIFISHRRIADKVELTEVKAKLADKNSKVLICNSISVPDMGKESGKGADMRRTLYYINKMVDPDQSSKEIILVFLDADVLPKYFGSHFVLGLAGAAINGFDFVRASFWREMGRVKKYVVQPLFSVIDHPAIEKLTGFSYPLSGEMAATLEFLNSVHFSQVYGVETGINVDSCYKDVKVADVNLGLYDHDHHPDIVIQKMSFGIIRTYLLSLMEYGIIQLKDGAHISDVFKFSEIDKRGIRQYHQYNLKEHIYQPLKNVI